MPINDNFDSFRFKTTYYFGLFSIGLIVGGSLIIPVCPPVGIMLIMAGSLFLLNIPMMF